jgi:hypothetical protein
MAAGVATVTVIDKASVFGERRVVIASLAFSDNYATGGLPLTAAQLGLTRLDYISIDPMGAADAGTSGVIPHYDYSSSKMQFFEAAGSGLALLEKTDAEAFPASMKVRVMAYGI